MYLLNLSLFQFLAVFGSISAISVALYLLDRSRRKLVVSTLRFWVAAEQPAVAARRRRIQQPWSLLLQLVSMGLLLLAIAQLRLGTPLAAGRDHVIVLDTSSWMAARSGNRTLMDVTRDRARQYLHALPARDRVMLVRADGMATPATVFEPDHKKVEKAIDASQPGSTALNLDQALVFARHIQGQDGRRVGEIAFIGPGRTSPRDPASAPAPPRNLRVISVADNVENVGLRKVGMRRADGQSDTWEIFASVRNYGARTHTVNLALDFGPPGRVGRVAAGGQSVTLAPGAEEEATFEYKTAAAGVLGVTVTPHDGFPSDDHAELELPAQPSLHVVVYSAEPDLLKPALAATPRVTAEFRRPEEYRPDDHGLLIFDRFIPPQRPAADSIWIDPPSTGSPVPVRSRVENVQFSKWDSEHPAAAGLHTHDFKLDHVSVFEASEGRVAEVEAGPVIVTRAGTPKIAVLGFHPALSPMRYELATPLLFANLLRWMSPEIFRRSEISGSSVGAVKLVMDKAATDVKVTGDDGSAVPFTLRDRTLNFFSAAPGGVKVVAGDREYLYSLTLPELWDTKWTPPADVHSGIPRFTQIFENSRDLWPWLALAGALGLLAEWFLYGRFRRTAIPGRTLFMRSRAEKVEVGR
ncbi:MAG TPA: BatA and WFA domain-containing protein [Candidatus Acidoferrum sp.]|nr:BatA and WFA domain-containing protein [Candidatus Acidoferrum sp.]